MTIAFAADTLVDRIGWLLIHSVWQFTLIALLLAVALRLLRRAPANVRYMIALAGWSAMLLAPAITWPLVPAPVESVAPGEPSPTVEISSVDASPSVADVGVPPSVGPVSTLDSQLSTPPATAQASSRAAPAEAGTPTTWTEDLNASIAPWLNSLVAIWCVGMCLFAVRSARGWYVVRRLLHRDVVAASDELTALLVRVAKPLGLKYRVRLLQSPHVDVPVAIGWLRPVVLLPVCVATGFSPQQLEAILAHELAHIRRHDYLINLLQNLSETVFFYHPALWWASAVVRREREHCCDELAARALGNRAEYGRALLALEELRGTTPAFAVGAKTGSLLERIRRLAQLEPTPRIGAGGVLALVLVAALVVSAAVWGATSLPEDEPGDSVPTEEPKAGVASQQAAIVADPGQPFVVRGRVTDENQHPLAGVEVVAHAGVGTLRRTGSATTDEHGAYTLRFGPGVRFARSERAPLSVGVQVGTISPRLDGWYEVDLHRQGNLGIADHPLSDEERKGYAGYTDIVQPESPYELNFVMARGATIEGRFVNDFGKAIADESVRLDGDELPPSSSVLDSAETDDEGRFRFNGVPLNRDWHFTVRIHGTRDELTGEPFRFEKAELRSYELALETTEAADGKAEFRLEQTEERQSNPSARVESANDVRVQCVDADGQPVDGAEVYVYQFTGGDEGRYQQAGPFTTDVQGRIAGVAAVVRDDEGHFDRFFYARVPGKLLGVGRSTHWKNRAIYNAEGRIEMRPSRSIEGHVITPTGVDPTTVVVRAQSLWVQTGDGFFDMQSWPRDDSFPGLDTGLPEIFDRRPNAEGFVQFTDVPVRGRLSLLAHGEGLGEGQWWNADSKFDEPIEIRLRAEGVLTGRALGPDGNPVAGVVVSARRMEGGYLSTTRATTGDDGEYRIGGLASVRFNVTVNDPQQRWVCRPQEMVAVLSGKATDLDLQLAAPIVVSGRAVDSSGNPVAGAAISALTDTRNDVGLDHDMTDDDGRYSLRLPPGAARLYFNSLPDGFAYPDPQITHELDVQPGQAAIDNGDFVLRRQGEVAAVATESPAAVASKESETAAANDEANSAADPDQDDDGGSRLLRALRQNSKPLLAALAEKHGYGLKDGEDVKRVPMPFDDARMDYYRVGNPGQADAIPRGPESMLFHWQDETLTNWGMMFGDSRDPGQSVAGLCEWILDRMSQDVDGPPELLQQRIPGDWVRRLGSSEESRLAQLNRILAREAPIPVRLALRTVERPVYVAKGVYKLTPLPGESGEDRTQLTDGVRVSDHVHIFGEESDLTESGAGGGCGDFDEFLSWLGRWIESPIINDVETAPTRSMCWSQHEGSRFTDDERKLAHDPESVLTNITRQTGLTFQKQNRDVRILFVEEVERSQANP